MKIKRIQFHPDLKKIISRILYFKYHQILFRKTQFFDLNVSSILIKSSNLENGNHQLNLNNERKEKTDDEVCDYVAENTEQKCSQTAKVPIDIINEDKKKGLAIPDINSINQSLHNANQVEEEKFIGVNNNKEEKLASINDNKEEKLASINDNEEEKFTPANNNEEEKKCKKNINMKQIIQPIKLQLKE